MWNRWVPTLWIVVAASLSGCSPTVKVGAPKDPITINLNIKLDAETRVLGEKEARPLISADEGESEDIRILSRAFLPRSIMPESGFGFYAYLLFPRNLPDTYAQRLGAASAFLCLFEDVAEAVQLVGDGSALAVLYAPIISIGLRDEILSKRDPALLLRHYDYRRAYLFAIQNDLDPNALYIVGQRMLFAPERGFNPTQSQSIELSTRTSDEIFAFLASLEDRLIENRVLVAESKVDLFESWRAVFRTLGEFTVAATTAVATVKADQEDGPTLSCP
jgi:hypothetical protein